MILNFASRKNARVLGKQFLRCRNNYAFQGMNMMTHASFSNMIQPPKDKLNPGTVKLDIGDYATLERKFTAEDIKNFAIAAQDKHAHHLHPENAKTFYKSNIVYGIFSSTTFTMIMRDLFPGAVYLGQTLKFTAPVTVDENIQANNKHDRINT